MPVFDILCLAASYKRRGLCIAGLRVDGGGWIRPCAPTQHGELYPVHYNLHYGGAPRVLDVIRISFDGPQPEAHQPENWMIADDPWQLIQRGLPNSLMPLLAANVGGGPQLLGDNSNKTEFVNFTERPAAASLALIQPSDLRWRIYRTPENSRKPRALFQLRGTSYSLPVTDPAYIDTFRSLSEGTHPVEALGIDPAMRILLTVSLSEPFEGYCYKLVCAIVPVAPGLLAELETSMANEEAAWIIDALARGADPYSREPLPCYGPLANPDTIKALRAASAALRASIAHKIQPQVPDSDRRSWDFLHGRTIGAIKARLIRLGKIED